MASGIDLSRECRQVFEQIRKLKQHRYAVFVIQDELVVKVERLGVREASYDDFLEDLHRAGANQCRFAVYDYAYQHQCQGASSTHNPYLLRYLEVPLFRPESASPRGQQTNKQRIEKVKLCKSMKLGAYPPRHE